MTTLPPPLLDVIGESSLHEQGRRRGLRGRQRQLPGDALPLALLALARTDRRLHPRSGRKLYLDALLLKNCHLVAMVGGLHSPPNLQFV